MGSDRNKSPETGEFLDEDLGKLFQKGSKESGDELFAKNRADLMRLAKRFYPTDPEALLHEAYLTANVSHKSFGPPYHYRQWMDGILHNISRNRHRADRRESNILGPEASDEDMYKVWGKEIGSDRADLSELLRVLNGELAHLDASHQKIGRYMADYLARNWKLPSKRDIEQSTGIPASTAERRAKDVLEAWRGHCKASGFWPLV